MDNLLELQMANAAAAGRTQGAPNVAGVRNEAEARQVAEDFESFFLSQMIEQMFSEVGQDNPFSGGAGEKAFRGLLHEEYAKVMAQSGGLGLADRLTTEVLRYQEDAEL
jgi:Rod binding domain-containing protein